MAWHDWTGPALAGLLLCAGTNGGASAASAAAPLINPPVQEASTELTGRVELARLVDLCAFRLGLNIEYDPATLEFEVTLRLGAGVSDEELWALTNRLLASRGFTSVQPPGEGGLSIVSLTTAASLARLEPDASSAPAGFIRAIVPIERLQPSALVEPLRSLLGGTGSLVTTLGKAKAVLVAGLKQDVLQAIEFVEQLESQDYLPVTTIVPVEHRRATEVVAIAQQALAKVRAIVGSQDLGDAIALPDESGVLIIAPRSAVPIWEGLVERFDTPPKQSSRVYVVRDYPVSSVETLARATLEAEPINSGQWRLVADELTGSLIVLATDREHRELEQLFERLQASAGSIGPELRSFSLKHRSAVEVLATLQGILDVEAAPSEGGSGVGTAAGVESGSPSAVGTGQAQYLGVDAASNRLLVFADPRVLATIEGLLAQIDVPQLQVQLEVLLVTLNEAESRDLGVELQHLIPSDNTLVQLGTLFGFGVQPLDGGLPAVSGTGFTAAALDTGEFSALLRALENVSNGRSQALPSVLVNNNETATLDSVLEQPFLATNASDTVATTSLGGSSAAGTTVQVTPTIVAGDRLILDYRITVSTFVGDSADPGLPPPRQENALSSVVTIPDGFTVVVGGIELETQSDGQTRVPILGSLPLIGALFRSDSRGSDRTRFYAFIRAKVDRTTTFAALKARSQQRADELDVDDGWPTLAPRIMR